MWQGLRYVSELSAEATINWSFTQQLLWQLKQNFKKKKLLWWRPCVLKLQNVGMEIFFASFSPLSLCLSLYLYVNYFWWHLLVTASFSCKRITQDQPWRPHFIPPENTRKPLVFCFFRGYKIGTLARSGLRGYIFWGCYGAFSVAMSKLIPAVYV